jgi:hypothetical protein
MEGLSKIKGLLWKMVATVYTPLYFLKEYDTMVNKFHTLAWRYFIGSNFQLKCPT